MIKSKVQNDVGHKNNGNIKFSFLLKVALFDFALFVGKKCEFHLLKGHPMFWRYCTVSTDNANIIAGQCLS